MKKCCDVCNNKVSGFLSKKLNDGIVCANCLRIYQGIRAPSVKELQDYWRENNNRKSKFNETQRLSSLGVKIIIDYPNRLFYFSASNPIIFSFSEVISYEIKRIGEKQVTKTKHGITRAMVGGALAGPVGAVVGSNTSRRETETKGGLDCLYIHFELPQGNYTYTVSYYPTKLIQFLDECLKERKDNSQAINTNNDNHSRFEEIRKYKELLDCGAITEAEFNAKKKELLNL